MKTLSGILPLILIAVLASLTLFPACATDDDPVIPPLPARLHLSGSLGTTGGTLISSDGKLSLTVPAGALLSDTDISITEIDPLDTPDIFTGLAIGKAFQMDPAGLDFSADVEIAVTIDLPGKGNGKTTLVAESVQLKTQFFAKPHGELDCPEFLDTKMAVEDHIVFSTFIRSLGALVLASGGSSELWFRGLLSTSALPVVHQPFETVITLMLSRLMLFDLGPRFYYSANSFTFELENGDPMTHDSETTGADGSTIRTYGVQTTASDPGVMNLACAVWLIVTPQEEAFTNLHLPTEILMPKIEIKYTYQPHSLAIQEEDPPSEELEPGVYDTGFQLSEGLRVFRGMSGWRYDETVAVSHGDGLTFLGLTTDPPLATVSDDFETSGNQLYGSLVMEYSFKKDTATGYRILLIGPNGGALSSWNSESNSFGMQLLFAFSQNLTDAVPFDDNNQSSGYCYVNNTSGTVYLVAFNQDTSQFETTGSVFNFPDSAGKAISAFARENGSLLTVVDGSPGRLYLHDLEDPFEPAVLIADLGSAPRRIRALHEVAVISNFGSGTLSILSWDQADQVLVTETIAVGDGPVGIDLLELTGGEIAIASTGFNDDTFWVTVVSSAGALISNSEFSLPTGVNGGAHAVWLHDGNRRIMISGNTSGNLAVVESGL